MFDDLFLGGFIKKEATVPIQDLSWLDVDEEEYRSEERLPDNKKTLNMKDQLRELWDHTVRKGPKQFNLLPNTGEKVSSKVKSEVTEESIADLIHRTRLALSYGKYGKQLIDFIRSNFDKRTIIASQPLLKKVAREEGYLGFVYVDPSLFDCQKAKISSLKNPYIEMVLKQPKCSDCKFASAALCLKFEKPLVEKVVFSSELLTKLKNKLSSRGYSFQDDLRSPISTRIKNIFLTKKLEKSSSLQGFPKTENPRVNLDPRDFEKALATALGQHISKVSEQTDTETAEKQKIISEVSLFLKSALIQGYLGTDLAKILKKKFSSKNLKIAEKSVRYLIGEQGLYGNVYVTIDGFKTCSALKTLLQKSGSLATFVQKDKKCASCAFKKDSFCSKLNLKFYSEHLPLTPEIVSGYINEVASRNNISSEVLAQKFSSDSPVKTLKNLFLKKSFSEFATSTSEQKDLFVLGRNLTEKEDLKKAEILVTKIQSALKQGSSLKAIQKKLETLVPADLARDLLKTAFKEAVSINSKVFKYCQKLGTEGYTLNKSASLMPKVSCSDCIFNSKVYCTKLGTKFLDQNFRAKKEKVVDTASEMQQFFKGSKIAVKLDPKPKSFEGEIEGLDEFTIV